MSNEHNNEQGDSQATIRRLAGLSKNQLLALVLQLQKQKAADADKGGADKAREPIAIIGAGCRFPGNVEDLDSYWALLSRQQSGITEAGDTRWDCEAFFDPDPQAGGKHHTRHFGLVSQVDGFDADFFAITPREAESMDPQQRLLLEVTWEAIESSGHSIGEYEGRSVGIFVGMMNKDYLHINEADVIGSDAVHSPYYASGEAFSIAAGRLAYVLGVHGPTLTLDTACSSSLVAIHLACRSLLDDECEVALAGGTSLILSPEASIVASNARMLSPSGQCWSFDEKADGYVRSEGVAMVKLKKLTQAIDHRDPVIAVIEATAVNHDGRSQGLTAPSSGAQIALMQTALKQTTLNADDVAYIEAHGTGTPLGDPIEMNSIRSVYGSNRQNGAPVSVGSVKSNIGHCEGSAGISGLLKLALCVERGAMVGNANFARLNPHVVLGEQVRIAEQTVPWEALPKQRIGAVNSFGFSGTNAHAILRGSEVNDYSNFTGPALFVLSAKSQAALLQLCENFGGFVAGQENQALADICYTACAGRDHFEHRFAAVVSSTDELTKVLAGLSADSISTAEQAPFTLVLDRTSIVDITQLQQLLKRLGPVCDFNHHYGEALKPWLSGARELALIEFVGLLLIAESLVAVGLTPQQLVGKGYMGELAAAVVAGLITAESGLALMAWHAKGRVEPMPQPIAAERKLKVISPVAAENAMQLYTSSHFWQGYDGERTYAPSKPDTWQIVLSEHFARPGEAIEQWLKLLAVFYRKGELIDFAKAHSGLPYRRVRMPTYAFQRKRYWADNAFVRSLHPDKSERLSVQNWLYCQQWQSASINPGKHIPGQVVILAEGEVSLNRTLPDNVKLAALAENWHEPGVVQSTLEQYLPTDDLQSIKLVLWHDGKAAGEDIVAGVSRLDQGLVNLVNGLLARRDLKVQLYLVSSLADDDSPGRLADNSPSGFAKVLEMEQPQLQTTVVRLDNALAEVDKLERLLELLSAPGDDNEFLLQPQQTCVRRLARVDARQKGPQNGFKVQPDKAYLVTGGNSGIGLQVGQWLLSQGAGQVLLCARSGVDDALMQLHFAGDDKVVSLKADVTDSTSLEQALAFDGRLPLGGIFHGAGVLADALVQNLDVDKLAKVQAPKVGGSLNLLSLTREHQGCHLVLFSSIAAVIGSAGQANYAAANAFMQGLAAQASAQGLPVCVINWGPWAEVGMASAAGLADKLDKSGLRRMAPEKAIAAMAEVLELGLQDVSLCDFNWPQVADYLGELIRLPLVASFTAEFSQVHSGKDHSPLAEELAALPEAGARLKVEQLVVDVVREVLALDAEDALSPTRALPEMGMDSLLSVELRNKFGSLLGENLPVSLMFDYPTVETLSEFFYGLLSQQLEGRTARQPAAKGIAHSDEAIAVIGMGCRLPGGADNPEKFWQALSEGRDLVGPFGDERWDIARHYRKGTAEPGMMYANFGGQIDNVHHFDNRFFAITDREAALMDPQQRIVLEVAWETIESAAYDPFELAEQGGIFIGPGPSDFAALSQRNRMALNALMGPGHHISAIAGRLAFALNWQGPALTVDTACSSSLVAVHLASEQLRSGQCKVALAGGINLILSPNNNIVLSKAGMLSADGKCKTFDADANGYVRSDGCAMVLLKRLSDAQSDGDNILACILGSAVNHNGAGQLLTAPSAKAQSQLIETALARAGVSAEQVDYVEAHGTGTSLGDPIEVEALRRVYGKGRSQAAPLYVGAVKSVVGHTEAAAGTAGLVKTLLMLQHGQISPSLHIAEFNPHLGLEEGSIVVPTALTSLPERQNGVICGVSSFGFSGTNAHLIVQQYVDRANHNPLACNLFMLSAKTGRALVAQCDNLLSMLERGDYSDEALAHLCFSSVVGRTRFDRVAVLYPQSIDDLSHQLKALREQWINTPQTPAKATRLRFDFCGIDETLTLDKSFIEAHPLLRQVYRSVIDVVDDSANARAFIAQYLIARTLWIIGVRAHFIGYHGEHGWVAAAATGLMSVNDAWKGLCGDAAIELPKTLEPLSEPVGNLLTVGLGADPGEHLAAPWQGEVNRSYFELILGSLLSHGVPFERPCWFDGLGLRRRVLPSYPFERKDFARSRQLLPGERSVTEILENIEAATEDCL